MSGDYDNLIRQSFGPANPALPPVVGNIDADPDRAARALELANASGVPASAVFGDLDEFERQQKSQLASKIVQGNPHLSDFVQASPLNSVIANDDYGTLDSISNALSLWGLPMKALRAPEALAKMMWPGDPLRRFTEGGPIGSWIKDSDLRDHPFAAAVAAGLGTPIELTLRGLSGLQMTTADAAANLTGALGQERLGRDIAGMVESAGLTGRTGLVEHPIFKATEQWARSRHFVENGREPPPGVLPEYDAFRSERNAKDVEALTDVVADAQTSTLRERNPDLFRDFIARHTDAEIGVSGDAVALLYGEKTPLPDDGLLGWVPNIEAKLNLARASGDDISIPLADWVARVDPAVMKALSEDIRVRPGAITAREAMLAKEADAATPPPIPLPEEVPTLRAASGLEPLFSIGDRKLKLERKPLFTGEKPGLEAAIGADEWRLMDENGNKVGLLELTPIGDRLYTDMVMGLNGLGPKDFGPALMRDLLKQIKEAYPNAKEIGGYRVSGMREKFGTEKEVWIKLQQLDALDYDAFRRVLEGGQWETYSPAIQGYVVPDALRSEQTSAIANAVREELDRIVPQKVAIETPDTLKVTATIPGQRAGEPIRIGGVYIRYRDTYPIILAALDADNVMLTARHEAVHHLRQYGFFKPGEWQTLEAEALAGNWFKKHRIDERYPNAKPDLKLEEAIAEEYPKWVERQEALRARADAIALPDSPLDAIFRRMKEFFDAIKDRISEILGKEATWEDVFKKVDTGEIGARQGTRPLDPKAFDERLQTEDEKTPGIINLGERREQREVGKFHKELMGDVVKSARERERLGREYHESGKLPFQVGTRFSTEHSRRNNLAPLEVVGHYVDRKEPEKYGYYYRRGDEANREEGIALVNDPNRPKVAELSKQFVPFKGPIRSLDERLQVEAEPPADPARVFERANALGMTIDQYKRYEKRIAERNAEDIASATRRATEAQRRVQSAQWKEDRKAVRAQVAEEINLRPDIAADNYFADGVLYGEKVERQRFGTDFLTPEQRAALPRDYYVKAGVHPDDLAPLFGYPDGNSLVAHLSGLTEVRRQSGMRPIEFKRRMIDIETDRQMRLKYGVLEDNILDAVKEQVASETQLDLLAEETIYYGIKSGQEPAFDQATIKRVVAEEFEASSQVSVSSDRYLAAAGRAGKAVENALLKQDYEAAFREKQRQYYATLLARNAVEFEAKTAKFEKLSAKLTKREVAAVEPEYLDFIHGLLGEAGVPVKRSMVEIADSKVHYGHTSLGEFVQGKRLEGYDLDQTVAESLWYAPPKALDAMTVGEMQEFMDAVTSLNHVGRKVRKIELAGEAADFAEFRQRVIDNISSLPARSRASQGKWSVRRWLYMADASLTRMEELAKDLDLRAELGPLHQAVIEPMMRSKAAEFDLMTDLSKHFQATRGSFDHKWRKSLGDTIEQEVFHDPYTDTPYDMTRENLLQVMLNWGNRSNIGKIVNGAFMAKFGRRASREEFAAYEAQIKGLIDLHARPEDWQFVQRMWEPFRGWESQMTTVARNTTGVAPKMIQVTPVETPFGQFEGGYWPVKYDRLGSNISTIESRGATTDDGVFGSNYFRAATAKGYLKERTGYVDFVDISTSLEQAVGTMQQTIHDIAFRDSLLQASRVFYDKGIRAAIRKHYGAEYEAQLIPWLRAIAHQFSTDDASVKFYNDVLRRLRINLVGHALPLNLKVILSPDVGVPNPAAWARYVSNRTENTRLAMEHSDEIRHLVYNMDRDFRESLARITLDPTVGDLQQKAVKWGFVPIAKVSQEFRIATFVDQYHKAIARGKTEQEAALIADSFVRERHGAASIVDLPAIMRGNEGMKMLTMFYGYFNAMYNWQRQIPGNIRRGEWSNAGVNGLGSVVVGAAFGAALFNQRKKDDSWFEIMSKAMLLQPLSTVPGLREGASYFVEGFQPRTPLASLLGAAGSILTDARKAAKGQRVDKPITHVANVVGLSTGLPLAQIGRTGQFASDVIRGRQRPKNIVEYARGIITGEAKLKR